MEIFWNQTYKPYKIVRRNQHGNSLPSIGSNRTTVTDVATSQMVSPHPIFFKWLEAQGWRSREMQKHVDMVFNGIPVIPSCYERNAFLLRRLCLSAPLRWPRGTPKSTSNQRSCLVQLPQNGFCLLTSVVVSTCFNDIKHVGPHFGEFFDADINVISWYPGPSGRTSHLATRGLQAKCWHDTSWYKLDICCQSLELAAIRLFVLAMSGAFVFSGAAFGPWWATDCKGG